MAEQPKSAAASLYPHLPSADPEPRGRAQSVSLAHSMYPSLVPPRPAPPNRNRESEVSLAALCDENPWLEVTLAMSGLRRKR
jgi:hypothetical protein